MNAEYDSWDLLRGRKKNSEDGITISIMKRILFSSRPRRDISVTPAEVASAAGGGGGPSDKSQVGII